MEKLFISVNLVNAVLQYLGTQPNQKDYQLVEALQKEAKEQTKEPE